MPLALSGPPRIRRVHDVVQFHESHHAPERQEEKHGLDLLVEAERVRHKAWELLGRLEAEGDHRGSVVALREVRGCMETLGGLLNRANGLADVSDAAILEEAKRRGLSLTIILNPAMVGCVP